MKIEFFYSIDKFIANIENQTGGKAFNLPITLADVVPTYNLPSIEEDLVFSGDDSTD